MGHVARSASFKLTLLWSQPSEGTEQRPPRTGCFARLQACNGQNPDGSPLSPHEAGQIACHTRSQAVSILDCIQSGPSQSGQTNSNSSSVAIQRMTFTINEQNRASTLLIRCFARGRSVGDLWVVCRAKAKWLTKPNAGAYVGRSAMMYCPHLARLRQLSQRLPVSRASWVSTPA